MATAREVVASWPDPVDDRTGRISAAARAEFGRRGYEAATMRDIAAAAGLAPQAVYRLFPSKEELFAAVMESYRQERQAGWDAVLGSPSSSVEKLDALAWLNISLMQQFRDELRIQLAWMRESTPNIRSLLSTDAQRRDILGLVDAGTRGGELAFDAGGVERWTTFVYEALWTPETVVRAGGTAAAHTLARQTVLRGALSRS
jgi:AcrR family transcriptional regulator